MNRLAKLRKENNYSMSGLADALVKKGYFDKISDATISNYENGKREPKLATWEKLANFFNVPVWYLQGFEEISFKEMKKAFKNAENETAKKNAWLALEEVTVESDLSDFDRADDAVDTLKKGIDHDYFSTQERRYISELVELMHLLNQEDVQKMASVMSMLQDAFSDNSKELKENTISQFSEVFNSIANGYQKEKEEVEEVAKWEYNTNYTDRDIPEK